MEEKNVALKPCLSHFVGGKETTPFKLAFPIYGGGVPRPSNLPPTARRGEGDHEVVEGGRRLAVRTAMEHPIGALPRTPFPASRDFPSRGNEKICGTGYCVTYDTDSQSRNADFISIARRAIHNPRG